MIYRATLVTSSLGFISTLALICGLIAITSEAAQARAKRPLVDTGSCGCTCNSNEKNDKGKSKWSADGPVGKGMTSSACEGKIREKCVVMSPFGLKPGAYGGCLWTLTSP